MPLTRIAMKRGKSADYQRKIMDQVYQALCETFDVPEDDRFMTISEHGDATFDFGKNYLDIDRSDDLLLIQLTVSNTRNLEQKQALFARIVKRLTETPGLRPEDIFINLVEVPKENWSFGHGLAQYA
ncbi:tautomerase family protein [Denitrobaculum tricleocarpae]|uniref:Tautomerase family protein n=1 Tax=Denitrobaculum tricleocarpae TaxID=2591009 RepID=A0A545TKR6_9PROT|nr:tautomerase family protein [Denitrobaculum tricleocarpae]TQV77820.1 tautomerase family protein [Denitrobaculum tricleocarpae]